MGIKHTYESVKYYIEVESNSDCELLSTEYINVKTNLKLKCKCGNDFERTYRIFRMGHVCCNICSNKNRMLSFEEVRDYINSKGCKLLSNEYNGYQEYLKIQCSCENVFYTTFASFKQSNKHTCDECTKKRMSENLNLDFEYVKYFIEVESNSGCKLLQNFYINYDTNIILQCPCGNKFETTFAHFKQKYKRQCNECSTLKRVSRRKTQKQFIDEVYNLVKDDYSVLGEYIDNNTNILMRHNNCVLGTHEYMVAPSNFLSGKRCPECAKHNTRGELSNFWKGGITPKNKLERGTSQYKEWRKQVFERDNYTCQCCGSYGGKLNAHHKENFSNNHDLRFDIDNGITLCKNCHHPNIKGSFHNVYGTKNNDSEQLKEYINSFKMNILINKNII